MGGVPWELIIYIIDQTRTPPTMSCFVDRVLIASTKNNRHRENKGYNVFIIKENDVLFFLFLLLIIRHIVGGVPSELIIYIIDQTRTPPTMSCFLKEFLFLLLKIPDIVNNKGHVFIII